MPADDRPAPAAIELIGLRAGYGRIEVLHGVDLSVAAGSVFALLGANGAGKTTTLGVLAGRIPPTAGCVHIAGVHMNDAAPHVLARSGVCTIPEGRAVFPNLTVTENLALFGLRRWRRDRDAEGRAYAQFPALATRRGQLAGTLSGGEQQMLAMARALAVEPSVLLLDELSMGLGPQIVDDLYAAVRRLTETGITVLLVEQFAKTALAFADGAAIMRSGVIHAAGRPDEIAAALSDAYLGTVA
ncbi:MAG: transporter related [Acidimicrobiales bacterium]|nr:transporter related [Acidimicrobiales bacterium]